jgi:hypothetical protein
VEEVVRYDDTDGNGFLDTIAYDYDGDRTFDFTVSHLDYRTPENPHPDVVPLVDTQREGWAGLHATFDRVARSSWLEALDVYNAAWRRGLTTQQRHPPYSTSALEGLQDYLGAGATVLHSNGAGWLAPANDADGVVRTTRTVLGLG